MSKPGAGHARLIAGGWIAHKSASNDLSILLDRSLAALLYRDVNLSMAKRHNGEVGPTRHLKGSLANFSRLLSPETIEYNKRDTRECTEYRLNITLIKPYLRASRVHIWRPKISVHWRKRFAKILQRIPD